MSRLSSLLVGRNNNKKTSCQRSCSWNVGNVSGECSNYSKILEFVIFSPQILEIFENSFWCLKLPPKFRNYEASNFFIELATPRTEKFKTHILSSLIFFLVERPVRVLLGMLIYLFTCWSIFWPGRHICTKIRGTLLWTFCNFTCENYDRLYFNAEIWRQN